MRLQYIQSPVWPIDPWVQHTEAAVNCEVAGQQPLFGNAPPIEQPAESMYTTSSIDRKASVSEMGGAIMYSIDTIRAFVDKKLRAGLMSAAAVLVAKDGRVLAEYYFGSTLPQCTEAEGQGGKPVDQDSLFDMESITKVVATLVAIFVLVDKRQLNLSDPVCRFIPRFAANDKGHITIHDMLSYSAGLPSDISVQNFINMSPTQLWEIMYETPLEYATGQGARYSDLSYRILGKVVEVVSEMDLASFTREQVWRPLNMERTYFNPPPSLKSQIVGTNHSNIRKRFLQGEVADELDYHLGGIAGCDGIFMNARDLCALASVFLYNGCHSGRQIFSSDLIVRSLQTMTPPIRAAGQKNEDSLSFLRFGPKSYGWEIARAPNSYYGTLVSTQAVGKAGGAGTFILIDPAERLIATYLTNYGLPTPFNPGWNKLISDLEVGAFFDWAVAFSRQYGV